MEPVIHFDFLEVKLLAENLKIAIEKLDSLAYKDARPPDKNAPSKWASPKWMITGKVDGQLVSQLCLFKREIQVGEHKIEVAGIGGVATHPDWQRKGIARQLMATAERMIRDALNCDFALLICNGIPCTIYQKAGWKDVAKTLAYQENGISYALETNVMVFEFSEKPFPVGEINLCGLPW